MTIKDRTYEFIKSKGLRTSQFETMCDLSNGYVSSMRRGFGDDKLNNVLKVFPDLNRNWLLFGEGEMLSDEKDSVKSEGLGNDIITMVPLIPLDAIGGSLVGFSEDAIKSQDCEMVIAPIQGVDFAISIYGDSMCPDYPSGSRVFVKKIDPSSYIPWGSIFVLDTTNGIILKEVQPSDKEGFILCHSLNPSGRYKDFEVPMKDIRGMFKVLACVTAQW